MVAQIEAMTATVIGVPPFGELNLAPLGAAYFVETKTKRNPQPRRGDIFSQLFLASLENIPRVKAHVELLQQLNIFIAEGLLGMMLLLVLDITNYRAKL